VYNGIDPQEFIYSESKDDYFLFAVGDLSRANQRDSGLRWNYKSDVASGSSLLVGLMKKELSGGNAIGGQASNSLVGFENAKDYRGHRVHLFEHGRLSPRGRTGRADIAGGLPETRHGGVPLLEDGCQLCGPVSYTNEQRPRVVHHIHDTENT
jgi:hypothetical protein